MWWSGCLEINDRHTSLGMMDAAGVNRRINKGVNGWRTGFDVGYPKLILVHLFAGVVFNDVYAASKFAMEGFCESLAVQLFKFNVT